MTLKFISPSNVYSALDPAKANLHLNAPEGERNERESSVPEIIKSHMRSNKESGYISTI
jgi:hypothetical protein